MIKEVKIELTNRCSRNCKHCSSSATNDLSKVKELHFDNITKVITEAYNMGATRIVFTGGEPLMYERLDALVKLVHFLGLETVIYTYAYRNDENMKKYKHLIDNGLSKIIYSLADDLTPENDESTYSLEVFFDTLLKNTNTKLGFHYAVSKDSFKNINRINEVIDTFDHKDYFTKVSLLRFVPHGKGTSEMDLDKEELLFIKELYLNSEKKNRIRLGSPWNILGIENSPCTIADEVVIIGCDGIVYPCDSIKYFTGYGIGGNIMENSLEKIYESKYFKMLRQLKNNDNCSSCDNYSICRGGCIGQKLIASYENGEKELSRKLINKDPKCMR